MKHYRPIATYSTAQDIIDLFPCDAIKPDMGDIIYNYFKSGQGNPHLFVDNDEESYWSEEEAEGNFHLTKDGKHGVRFTRGTMVSGIPYGYFIDIYELVPEHKDQVYMTDEQLKTLSRERQETDARIKSQIIQEFKEAFQDEGEGLDFLENCPDCVYGMLDSSGEIVRMYLDDQGKIVVQLEQEWENVVADFESRYFACDNWAQLLLNVRRGIQKEWFIGES